MTAPKKGADMGISHDWHAAHDAARSEAVGMSEAALDAAERDAALRAHQTRSEADKGRAAGFRGERLDRNRAVAKAKGLI